MQVIQLNMIVCDNLCQLNQVLLQFYYRSSFVLYDNGAYHGVGTGPAPALLGQLQGQAHIILIVHGTPPKTGKRTLKQLQSASEKHRPSACLPVVKNSGMTYIPEQHNGKQTQGDPANALPIFFHPDYTVGFGIAPNHALRLADCTADREFHPALKILFTFHP